MDVRDKVCVVTGGASGIGRALVDRFVREGARHVLLVDRASAPSTDRITARQVDVTDEAALAALVSETESTLGPIDLFCSNAGILTVDPDFENVASLPTSEWNRAWTVNVMAHVFAARAVLPSMIARKAGYFLHTVSAAGLLSQIGAAAYSTTKHAAIGFAESLAITHRDHGIRVSVVCPQAVATPMIDDVPKNGADVDGILSADAVVDAVIQGLAVETFLILPHPRVADYAAHKSANYDRWIGGMAKARRGMRP
ncbi:MAG TPA: SDR family NAD(P)-dependent oxidoreductase [Kofleriaceae bacterium]|jgi:NAD(P)-dependent dehydrogenase (short-subunit alcohol dehydrogenase family)